MTVLMNRLVGDIRDAGLQGAKELRLRLRVEAEAADGNTRNMHYGSSQSPFAVHPPPHFIALRTLFSLPFVPRHSYNRPL